MKYFKQHLKLSYYEYNVISCTKIKRIAQLYICPERVYGAHMINYVKNNLANLSNFAKYDKNVLATRNYLEYRAFNYST